MKTRFVSIIIPVRNEERNLLRLLQSISRLDYPKNKLEVIIVDGYSRDKTVEIAMEYKAEVFFNKGKIRSTGCQIGIDRAHGEIVAFTDADCVVPRNWLKGLLKYISNKKVAAVGGPNVTPEDDSLFAKAVGKTLFFLTKTGARYGHHGTKTVEIFHNPGCNVIYQKEAIKKVGGFNPLLLTCEDEELDFRLREKGYKLIFTPDVVVDHYRRPTYKKILIQAYRFAVGRAQAIRLHPSMARWFHFIPTVFLPFSIAVLILNSTVSSLCLLYFLVVFLVFLSVSLYLSISKKYAPFYTYLFILLCWFLGWGIGFMKGIIEAPRTYGSISLTIHPELVEGHPWNRRRQFKKHTE